MEQDQISKNMAHQVAAGVIYRATREWRLSPEIARLSERELDILSELEEGKDFLIRDLSPNVVSAFMCKP
jgi:hypothetical protein